MTRLGPDHAHSQWLWREDTQYLLSILNDATAVTRCVGGCVRDALLGLADAETETDMATTLSPDEVLDRLRAAKLRWLKTGFQYGTVTAMLPDDTGAGWRGYEITTLRRDVETDGRHALVAATDDWAVDASRRDLTINALYVDADGTLHDPSGLGLDDVAARRVRFLGDPSQRIEEDYLRVLRYVRFHYALTPSAAMDTQAVAACAAAANGVAGLSPERRHVELMQILRGPHAAEALAQIDGLGLAEAVLGVATLDHARLQAMLGVSADPMLRLASLLQPAQSEAVSTALRLSKKQAARLNAALTQPDWASAADLPAALYYHGAQIVADQALMHMAAGGAADLCQFALARAADYQRPEFPLTGAMMKQAGMQAGPEMGAMHAAVESWWVAAGFPDAAAVEAELKRRL